MDDVEQRFLAAIQANPDDREAREVYADWLEERGDERGEYLRLEAQLHSIPVRLAVLRASVDPVWLVQVERRFDVVLVTMGSNKISVIKAVREASNIGLKDAKDFVEAVRPGAPGIVCRDLEYDAAHQIARLFNDTGAMVDIVSRGSPIAPRSKGITVTLAELEPAHKLPAMLAVRELTGLGLKAAKELVENVLAGTAVDLLTGVDARRAAEVIQRFATLGRVTCSPT
jgi:large subunit ribosomal protein L7/L12